MIRAQLLVHDPANRLTLKTLLEAEGIETADDDPEVVIADDMSEAVRTAERTPTLVLAAPSEVREAVAAMRRGVYGYVLLPLQPGEAALMTRRAAGGGAPRVEPSFEPEPLDVVEQRHILAVLRHCKNNQAKAARLLGIGRNTLWRKLKRYQARDESASR